MKCTETCRHVWIYIIHHRICVLTKALVMSCQTELNICKTFMQCIPIITCISTNVVNYKYGRIQCTVFETDIGILNPSALHNGLSDTPSHHIIHTYRYILYTKSEKNVMVKKTQGVDLLKFDVPYSTFLLSVRCLEISLLFYFKLNV